MRAKNLGVAPPPNKLFDLEKWLSVEENGKTYQRKQATIIRQVTYGIARDLKIKSESVRQLPGTYFKIV